jgi:hypothetical protein
MRVTTTEGFQNRQKAYQRLSLYRAKAKQLSSYGGKAFSMEREEREEWRQRHAIVAIVST